MYRTSGKLYKAEGIILSRKNSGEADRILTVFTREYGKIRVIAKGVRRVNSRRAPHLEVFHECSFIIHRGASMDSVSEVYSLRSFETIRSDLSLISMAYLYCELVSLLLADHQEHADVYDLMKQSLRLLDDRGEVVAGSAREFALELLWTLGFLPRNKSLVGKKLEAFVESIAERRLKTPKFLRKLSGEPNS